MKKTLFLFSLFLFVPFWAFAETETCICKYDTFSDEKGNHPVKGDFTLTFIIDEAKGNAYILGNQGSAEVMILGAKVGGLSFVEITKAGNVMTTTIDSKGNSVHSRNTVIYGEIVPTQYYGKCTFK